MMAGPLRNRLAGIALLLQVLATFGAARGLVLCVGPEGHVAVEDPQAALRCQESENGLGTHDFSGTSRFSAPATCVDSPILGVYPEKCTPTVPAAATAVAMGPVAEIPRLKVLASRIGPMREPAPPSVHVLRKVVLLI